MSFLMFIYCFDFYSFSKNIDESIRYNITTTLTPKIHLANRKISIKMYDTEIKIQLQNVLYNYFILSNNFVSSETVTGIKKQKANSCYEREEYNNKGYE